eukprot:315606-Amphidinium_carterae.1
MPYLTRYWAALEVTGGSVFMTTVIQTVLVGQQMSDTAEEDIHLMTSKNARHEKYEIHVDTGKK